MYQQRRSEKAFLHRITVARTRPSPGAAPRSTGSRIARTTYITPERTDTFWFQKYTALAMRFADIAAQVHADGLLSNHTIFDGSKTKLPLVRARSAEQVNPYVVGGASVQAYLTGGGVCEGGVGAGDAALSGAQPDAVIDDERMSPHAS